MRVGLLAATTVLAAMTVGAWADDDAFHPYFGAGYERGMLAFKTSNLYGKTLNGYSPFGGVTFGRYFAFEMSVRMGYGTGGSTPASTSVETTKTDTVTTVSTTDYHSSALGIGTDLYVRLPLGHTGLVPFVFTGLSVAKVKEMTQTDSTITARKIGATDPTKDIVTHATDFATLAGRSEVSPEVGLGLAYYYGGAELRVSGRVQNLNMDNSGKYLLTLNAGLLLRV